MKKIVIAGPPHSGKTTLFNSIKNYAKENNLTSWYFIPETGSTILKGELAVKKRDAIYSPLLPSVDYFGFQHEVFFWQKRQEANIPLHTSYVFLDRSLIDGVAYLDMNNFSVASKEARINAQEAHYDYGFFCEFVAEENYTSTETRVESFAESKKIRACLLPVYESLVSQFCSLEKFSLDKEHSLDKRMEFIFEKVGLVK